MFPILRITRGHDRVRSLSFQLDYSNDSVHGESRTRSWRRNNLRYGIYPFGLTFERLCSRDERYQEIWRRAALYDRSENEFINSFLHPR